MHGSLGSAKSPCRKRKPAIPEQRTFIDKEFSCQVLSPLAKSPYRKRKRATPEQRTFMDKEFSCRVLSPQDEAKWLDCVETAFKKKGTPRTFFQNQLHQLPRRTLFAVLKAETVVSTLAIFVLEFAPGIQVAALGSVATLPEYQKMGLAGRLLKFAQEHISRHSFHCSLLHSSNTSLQRYYEKKGWSEKASVSYGSWKIPIFSESSLREISYNGNVRRGEPADVSTAKQLFERLWHTQQSVDIADDSFMCSKMRTEHDWKYWYREDQFYVLEEEDTKRCVAYTVLKKHNGKHWQISEFAGKQCDIEEIVRFTIRNDHFVEGADESKACSSVEVQIPLKPALFCKWSNVVEKKELEDIGWRYYICKGNANKDGISFQACTELTKTLSSHFFCWRTDHF